LKELKPFHVLFFVFGTLLILAPIVVFVPKKGWDLGAMNLRFLTKNEFLHPAKQEKKDISKLVAKVDTTSIDMDPLLKHQNCFNGSMGAPSGGALSAESATEINMSEIGRDNLHRFFEKLQNVAADKKKIHILHYGDSQIEGDRMTAYIRQRIQNQFGGNGPGLVPAMNVYATMTFKQTFSPNFTRYTCFGGAKLKNRRYGAMGSAARFSPEMDSAGLANETAIKEAWIEIEPGKASYSRAREYNNVKMFYNSCYKPCGLKVYQNGNLIHEDSLDTDGKSHTVELTFPSTPGKLKYVFSAAVSPTITGFSLEGDYGVQVSNIGMRGSSGTIYGSMDQALLSKQYSELNTELIIMQFGGNSVPFFKDSSSVRAYTSYFRGQLNTIKKLRPSAAILVIGPSDMSKLDNGVFVSYPLLPYCVAQMKKVTMDVGAGYWDLFSAMGGMNSMPSWVEQGLAGKDYIHFSNKGASIASQLFFDAFAAEFAKWQQGGN
jgi:lysophospholipase L1-like esterase